MPEGGNRETASCFSSKLLYPWGWGGEGVTLTNRRNSGTVGTHRGMFFSFHGSETMGWHTGSSGFLIYFVLGIFTKKKKKYLFAIQTIPQLNSFIHILIHTKCPYSNQDCSLKALSRFA